MLQCEYIEDYDTEEITDEVISDISRHYTVSDSLSNNDKDRVCVVTIGNDYDKDLINICKSNGLYIVNGRIGILLECGYTCHSMMDYEIAEAPILLNIKKNINYIPTVHIQCDDMSIDQTEMMSDEQNSSVELCEA